MKRKHQIETEQVIDGIIAGAHETDIVAKVTPGGGKSMLPIIAGNLIAAGLADRICWICPRMTLQDQAERNFLDPFFRQMFDHRLVIRSSTNESNPCRGTNGFTTTYQAVGVDKKNLLQDEFRRHRYILVLDEFHHAEADDGSWTKALEPLYELAKYRVLMTGTLSRGDGKKIAFTPYGQVGEHEFLPKFVSGGATALVEYSRRDALAERAILPLAFHFLEGVSKWQTKAGRTVEAKLSAQAGDARASHALYTALKTEYAMELLSEAVAHWKRWRNLRPSARLLVVAAGIEDAKEYLQYLKVMTGLKVRIATSEDSPEAAENIKALKSGKVDALVTVAMAYEGLDAPSISHIACLTNIRTEEWITQMAARAVRIDPQAGPYEAQQAHIFAPNDPMMLEISRKIEAEQQAVAVVKASKPRESGNGDGTGEGRQAPGGITPLSSRLLNGQNGQSDFFREDPAPVPAFVAVETPHDQEAGLLDKINSHVLQYARQNRFNPKTLNGEIFQHFNKKRRNMTVPELETCFLWVKARYPLNQIRGTGRRVDGKARPLAVEWR